MSLAQPIVKEWKPFKRQVDFLSIPDTVLEALYGGAAGGGKSECLLMFPIAKGLYQYPRFKGLILRRTYPELEKEVILRSKEFYPHCGADYNEEKKRWTFPSGAIMQFGHCEFDASVRQYDSAEYQFVGWDELTSFTEFQYKYISFSRTRSSSGIPIMVRGATNPGNIGHSWVKKRFIDPAPYGTLMIDSVSKNKRIFIQSKATDNPHNDEGYMSRMQMLPEAERRAKLDGEWDVFEGQAFMEFRAAQLLGEPENALHVIKPFDIPEYYPKLLIVDWGMAALTYASWAAITPQKRLIQYREKWWRGQPVSVWATELKELSGNDKFEDVILCQSAWQDRGNDFTTAELFERYSGFRPRGSGNSKGSRILGKQAVHEVLRWQPKPRTTPQADYNAEFAQLLLRKSEASYDNYMASFKPEPPETNLPKLQIFNTCSKMIETIPLCMYEADNSQTGKNSEDVKEFKDDDPYDNLRYMVDGYNTFLGGDNLSKKADEIEAKDKIVKQLETSKDQTVYYRKMEALERSGGVIARPVRRFRRVA